jgi:hypothetical protein
MKWTITCKKDRFVVKVNGNHPVAFPTLDDALNYVKTMGGLL